ncbi:MAG: patatin-like phospholipase family protein [Planctomycetota bacterium]
MDQASTVSLREDPRCRGANAGLALALGGGGARAAYQAGVLRALGRRCPALAPRLMTGVSAGAINVAHLANRASSFTAACDSLFDVWSSIEVQRVFEARTLRLAYHALCVLSKATFGVAPSFEPIRGMVDARPLRAFLSEAYGGERLSGIRSNIASGQLDAVAILALQYATGRTTSFCEGRHVVDWDRPLRRSVQTELRLDHVLASSALPLFFPPVEVDGEWFGDGGVRLIAPLAPAVHLGAERILAISTRYRPSEAEAAQKRFEGAPSPANIGGNLFSAIFLDALDQDALTLERINGLVRSTPAEAHGPLRPIELFVVRPSVDLGRLANEFEARLPGMFRFLTRRLGTRPSRSQELLSTVLFQHDYVRELLRIGEQDGEAHAGALQRFLQGP